MQIASVGVVLSWQIRNFGTDCRKDIATNYFGRREHWGKDMASLAEKRSQETTKALRLESLSLFESGSKLKSLELPKSGEAAGILGEFILFTNESLLEGALLQQSA